MERLRRYTVKEFALQERKTEFTIRRWIDEGKIIVIDRDDKPPDNENIFAQKDRGGLCWIIFVRDAQSKYSNGGDHYRDIGGSKTRGVRDSPTSDGNSAAGSPRRNY